MPIVPLFGHGFKGKSATVSAQKRINLYGEKPFDPDKSDYVLYPRPGLSPRQFTNNATGFGGGPFRGVITVTYIPSPTSAQQDRVFGAVAGYPVVSVNNPNRFLTTAPTVVFQTTSGPMVYADNGYQVIGVDGRSGYIAEYAAGSTDQAEARLWAYRDRDGFQKLIDLLVETSIDYLLQQVTAGADALQIFDTWAGSLPDDEFDRWVVEPTKAIVSAVKAEHPHLPIIGFPRGAGGSALWYATETGVDGIGCDTAMPPYMMGEAFADEKIVVQGNLDPLLLVAGGEALEERTHEILELMEGKPFVFNLGHGIVPETPPENVARLVEIVRGS